MNSSNLSANDNNRVNPGLRAISAVLVFTLLWPSYAAAQTAVSSTLLQSPPFTPIDPPANVMLMLDDSGSMSGHTLPMPPDISLTTSTDPRLCNVAVTGYTTVESCGQVKLLTDSSNLYWVQEGNATPVRLMVGTLHVTTTSYTSTPISNPRNWVARGAETISGVNRILWQFTNGTTITSDDTLFVMDFDSAWSRTSVPATTTAVTSQFGVGTGGWKTLELDFWYDHNTDSKFGDSPVEWFDRVAISGRGGDEAGNWAERSFAVSRNDDWILRSPALNPLWYNPAVWYKPWNNNNQTGTGAFPNANIGGTDSGSVSSRPNNTQLTQRDMRRVPTGDTSTSLNTTAGIALVGTGALGTWDTYPDPSAVALGRTVTGTLSGTTVRFRYAGMPLEHGATGIPYNSATAASDAVPLDLFMRPIRTVTSTGQMWRQKNDCTPNSATTDSATKPATKRCYTRRNTCASSTTVTLTTTDSAPGEPAPPPPLSCWAQLNCANTAYTYSNNTGPTSKPADLSCWNSTCPVSGSSSGTGPAPTTISCPAYRQTSCSNTAVTTGSALTPLYCYRNCEDNSWLSTATNPGVTIDISCKRRDSNCNSSTSTYLTSTPTNTYCFKTCENHYIGSSTRTSATGSTAPSLPTCYRRAGSCDDTTIRYSDVTTLASGNFDIWCRLKCTQNRPWETLTVAPSPTAQCWNRARTDCSSATPLWTTIAPSPLTLVCPDAGSFTATSQPYSATRYPVQTFTRAAPELLPVTDVTLTRTVTTLQVTPAATVTPTSSIREAFNWPGGTPPSGAPSLPTNFTPSATGITLEPYLVTVSAGSSVTGPHVERLTPARYYYWNGTTANGGKGNPANYVLVQIDRTRLTTETYPILDATTGATVSSPRCAALTSCTWQEEAQNFANWYAYYRNRMFSSIAVMAEAMSSMQEAKFQNLRIGYGRINYFAGADNPWNTSSTFSSVDNIDGATNAGALIRGVRPFLVGSTERQQFFDWLFSLAWGGSTPNREAIDAAGRYFTRTDNKGPWGATPGTDDTQAHIACRRNFTLLATDGEWTNVSAGQPLISSTGPLADAAGTGNPTASDSVNGPTVPSGIDSTSFTYQPANYPQFTGGTSQDRTLTDVTVYYWNRDLRPDLANVVKPITAAGKTNEAFWQSMSTYIVGYGLFASMDTDATRMAIARGTRVDWPEVEGVNSDTFNSANGAHRVNDSFRAAVASRGQFYTATTVETLANAVLSTFNELVIQTGSAGGVALPGAVVQDSDLFYRPSYFLGQNTYGKLEAFEVSDMASLATNPDAVTPQWNASLPTSRTILTSTAATTATTFAATNLTSSQQTLIGGGNASLAGDVVNYLSGSNTREIANGGAFRNRISPFGTFVNSRPLYSKAPDFGYATLTDIGSAYKTFVDNNKTGRTAAVYIGGNAGMFHAFSADTGVELFAYVPRGVYDNLYSLTVPGVAHRYFVDGPVVQGDAYLGSAWKNIIVGTTGAGGASIFALDVTNPGAMDATKVLFDVTKADSTHLGNIFGTGVVGRIKTGTDTYQWVYIVGNGVESTSQQAALLVIPLEGTSKGVVTAIPVGAVWDNTVANRNGMGGINVVFGAQRNIIAVYGGDKLGNLWRFDFSQGIPTQASGFDNSNSPLFTAKDGNNNPQPITTVPLIYPYANDQWYVVFGTGKLYDSSDPTDTQVQSLYGLIFNPSETSEIQKSNLNQVTPSQGRFSATPSSTNKRGWYLNLDAAERVIGNPTIGNSLIRISTYKPSSSTNECLGGGTSRLFSINVLSSSGTVAETTATVANPVPHFKPRAYGSPATSPTRSQVQQALRGKAPSSSSSQCRISTVGVDKTIGGAGQASACPQTPVLRTWRQLAR